MGEGFNAVIEESTGKIAEYSSVLESSGNEIAAKQSELAGATKVRGTENSDFKAAESELVDSVDMLARAASVLKRELSFSQVGKSSKKINKKIGDTVTALTAIV